MLAPIKQHIEWFVAESELDWIQLWQVIDAARTATDADPAQDDVTRTLALVDRLLDRGFRVGEIPQGVSFVAWTSQDRGDIKRRIERDWQALGREPYVADIC